MHIRIALDGDVDFSAMTHKMVDQGADLIIGCHSHVPKPIEVYNGKLIIYISG